MEFVCRQIVAPTVNEGGVADEPLPVNFKLPCSSSSFERWPAEVSLKSSKLQSGDDPSIVVVTC